MARDDPIWHDAPPTTGEGELVVNDRQGIDPALRAAGQALQRMSEEGRSGKVTVSMAVEIRQGDDEPDPLTPEQLAERRGQDGRFALGIASAVGVLLGLFVASLSFVPDVGGLLVGVVAAAWIYGQVKP